MKTSFHYHSDISYERVYLNEFGKYLRDQADKDYVASRALYRRGLIVHSANLAHQSVEKYLKSILLFLAQDTKSAGHDIEKLLEKNQKLGLVLKDQSIEVVRLLSGLHNVSRYKGSGFFTVDYSFLYYLDYFVRDIRPWLQNRYVAEEWPSHPNPKGIYSGHDRKTIRIHLSGYLEKVNDSKHGKLKKLRDDLVWNNPFFGARAKSRIQIQRGSFSSAIPFNLDSEKDRERALHVANYFKFEPDIERFLKARNRSK